MHCSISPVQQHSSQGPISLPTHSKPLEWVSIVASASHLHILPSIIIKLLSLPSNAKVTNQLHAGKSGRHIITCSSTLSISATLGRANQSSSWEPQRLVLLRLFYFSHRTYQDPILCLSTLECKLIEARDFVRFASLSPGPKTLLSTIHACPIAPIPG